MPNVSRGGNRKSGDRKSQVARFSSATLLLVVLGLGFLVANNEVSQRATAFTPTVGLVNEDLAAEFNDKAYTFGANFVDRVSKESEYNWTVLSRPIAEKAYKDGSVDAILYLPQSFSRDILTLQDLDPTKATVEYKLRPQVDDQSDRVLKSKITDIVHGFNQSVVKMYYASVSDNIAQADGYMNAALGNHEALIAALTSDVEKPFSGTMPNFENFVSSATGLNDVNAATVEAQNSFTESVTNTLAATSETFWGKLPEIDEYANRQKEIAQINATNSNTGITNQAAADREFYGSQFDWLRAATLCKLSGVDATDLAEPCNNPDGTAPAHLAGQLGSLRQAIMDSAGSVGTLQKTVRLTRASLDTSIRNLETLVALLEPPVDPTAPADPTDPIDPTVPIEPTLPADPPVLSVPAVPITPAIPTINAAVLQILKAELDALTSARDALNADDVPGPQFDAHLTDLDTWYADALATVKDSALAPSTINGLELRDWTSYDPDGAAVYIDSSDDLRQSIADLVTQTAETSSSIVGSTLTVPDNSSLFDVLLTSANATFAGAETVHNGVNDVLSMGNTGLGKNQQYYQNFSTVLSNTRTQGVDTGKIHDFFSSPIDAKDITAERTAVASAFDMKWVIVFAGGLLVGALVTVLGRTFRTKRTA